MPFRRKLCVLVHHSASSIAGVAHTIASHERDLIRCVRFIHFLLMPLRCECTAGPVRRESYGSGAAYQCVRGAACGIDRDTCTSPPHPLHRIHTIPEAPTFHFVGHREVQGSSVDR